VIDRLHPIERASGVAGISLSVLPRWLAYRGPSSSYLVPQMIRLYCTNAELSQLRGFIDDCEQVRIYNSRHASSADIARKAADITRIYTTSEEIVALFIDTGVDAELIDSDAERVDQHFSETPVDPSGSAPEISSRGNGWFDVVIDGEPLNESALREDEARELATKLNTS
jgi:hypothetical protein